MKNNFLKPLEVKKKKDSPSAGPTPSTESPTEQPIETGEEEQFAMDFGSNNQIDFGGTSGQTPLPPITDPVGTKFGANVQGYEKNTWLEDVLGKNEVTDFFGDIVRATRQGIGQGATIDDARNLNEFKALYQDTYNYDDDGEITSVDTVARINRWTNENTVKEYIR